MKNTKRSALFAAVLAALCFVGTPSRAQQSPTAPANSVIKGSGTNNFIPIWTSGSTLGNSLVSQSGATVNVGSDQSISGKLALTGSINDALLLQGGLSDSNKNESANVIGGFCPGGNPTDGCNNVASGVLGATIAGGGGVELPPPPNDVLSSRPNSVSADWGTVGGGLGNTAGNRATVAVWCEQLRHR